LFKELSAAYPDVETDQYHIDALIAKSILSLAENAMAGEEGSLICRL
jgi:hypothetical protein